MRDVLTGDTTGVEGTHRQLRAGLADRLRGDDADGLADVDQLAGGQRAAVALRAGADLALAGEHRADLDLLDAGGDELVDDEQAELLAGAGDDRAVDLDVLGRARATPRWLDLVVPTDGAVGSRSPIVVAERRGRCRSRPRG